MISVKTFMHQKQTLAKIKRPEKWHPPPLSRERGGQFSSIEAEGVSIQGVGGGGNNTPEVGKHPDYSVGILLLGMSMGITMQSFVGIEHSVDFWRSAENPPPSAEIIPSQQKIIHPQQKILPPQR
jgi:hypothetical protein